MACDDVLWGGPGADTFRISSLGSAVAIKDSSAKDGDVPELHVILTGLVHLDGPTLANYLTISVVDGGTEYRVDTSGGSAFDEADSFIVLEAVDRVQGAADQVALLGSMVQADLLQVCLGAHGCAGGRATSSRLPTWAPSRLVIRRRARK